MKIDFSTTPGEYTYTESAYGKSAQGVVAVGAVSTRNNAAQREAGGEDRQSGDHGGHLIAHSLGGENTSRNIDAQAANVNQRGQRHVERDVENLARNENNVVFYSVQNYNSNGSQRPDATMITVAVQDRTTGEITDIQHHSFQNESYQQQAEWNQTAEQYSEVDAQQSVGMSAEEIALAAEYAEVEIPEETSGYSMADSISVSAADSIFVSPEGQTPADSYAEVESTAGEADMGSGTDMGDSGGMDSGAGMGDNGGMDGGAGMGDGGME